MRPFWARVLRNTGGVGIALAVIGYGLAQAFLFTHRAYAGDAYNSENERVLWQTPLVMATIGMLMTGGLEAFLGLIRKPAPAPVEVPVPANSAHP
ncbi:MAG TPA: hypothetical protein VKE40_00830 [Gemmataceae bacterium]|nr:hypothetical protein [Gemmataceae bacterium]